MPASQPPIPAHDRSAVRPTAYRSALLVWLSGSAMRQGGVALVFLLVAVVAQVSGLRVSGALHATLVLLVVVGLAFGAVASRAPDERTAVRWYTALFALQAALIGLATHQAGGGGWLGVSVLALTVMHATVTLPGRSAAITTAVAIVAWVGPVLGTGFGVLRPYWLFPGTSPLAGDRGFAWVTAVVGVLLLVAMALRLRGIVTLLRQAEARSRLVLETVPDMVGLFDRAGRLTMVNPAVEEQLGLSAATSAGTRLASLVHPDDVAHATEHFVRALRGAIAQTELRIVTMTGATRWIALTASPLVEGGRVTGVLVVARDVTDARLARDAVHESERRYRALTEASTQTVWICDGDGSLTMAAPRFLEFTGLTLEGACGTGYLEAIHPDDRARVQAAFLDALHRRQPYEVEHRLRRHDGEWRHTIGRAVPLLDDAGRVVEWVGTHTDVTERVHLEEQLRQSQKLEAIGRLAGGVAHDFNNLLLAIGANVELALAELPPGATAREDLEEVRRSTERATQLTRQLLTFGGKQLLQPRVHALNAVVGEAERLLRSAAGEVAAFTVALDPDAGCVRADQGQLEQVLMNLVVNARDAVGGRADGTVTVETRHERVDERTAARHQGLRPGRYATLVVRDTGAGMDAATRARVFEPFFTTKAQGRGTGLGLATVHGIVQQSGGHIVVQSAPGMGATFTIYLPRVEDEDECVTDGYSTHQPPAATATADVGGTTILLVEDEAAVRVSLRRILARRGYRVLEAKHGRDALLLWEAQGERIDLVLTDVLMPEMSGPELVRHLRARRPSVPVLFMSGYTGDAAVTRDVDAEDVLLQKPFDSGELLRRLAVALGQPCAAGEA